MLNNKNDLNDIVILGAKGILPLIYDYNIKNKNGYYIIAM